MTSAHNQRYAAVHFLRHQTQDPGSFLGQQCIALAGVSEQTQAVGTGLQKMMDQAKLAVQIQRTVIMESRIQDRENAFELSHLSYRGPAQEVWHIGRRNTIFQM